MITGNESHELMYDVKSDDSGKKIIDLLFSKLRLSNRLIKKCKREGRVALNGMWGVSLNGLCREGDHIHVRMESHENHFEPEDIPVEVVYEDQDLLIINKQPFMVVHPTKGHPVGTLANGIAYYLQSKGNNDKIRFINRLDRDTSGILLVAKNGFAQQAVSNQMRQGTVGKHYLAFVSGHLNKMNGTIDEPIGRPDPDEMHRAVMSDGQPSVTHYEVIARYDQFDAVDVRLETGRTHQIRVHMKHLGHPIIGDELYGGLILMNRQALHCKCMTLLHPRTQEVLTLEAPVPEDMLMLMKNAK